MPDIKIDPVAGAAWVAALDSGDRDQASGHLKSVEGGYCCLGVFAEVQGATAAAQIEENEDSDDYESIIRYDFVKDDEDVNNDDLLDEDWANQYGLSPEHQSFFSALNDGSSFTAFLTCHATTKLYPVMLALANDPVSYHGQGTFSVDVHGDYISIHFRKHSFREISEIIKTWFI